MESIVKKVRVMKSQGEKKSRSFTWGFPGEEEELEGGLENK